jgi:hypothetical protein
MKFHERSWKLVSTGKLTYVTSVSLYCLAVGLVEFPVVFLALLGTVPRGSAARAQQCGANSTQANLAQHLHENRG